MSSRVSPTMRGTLILIVIGSLVVALVWFFTWRGDNARRAEPGHVETSEDVLTRASLSAEFAVPGRLLKVGVTVGDTVSGLTSEAIRAPRGGYLVQVSANDQATVPSGLYDKSLMSSARLWLRSGTERILVSDNVSQIPGPGDDDSPVLAFGTGGRDLVAELEYAGRRQSVHLPSGRREAGAFARFYAPVIQQDPPDLGGLPGRRGSLEWRSTLSADWYRTPYLSGLGWAKEGREWLVVRSTHMEVRQIQRGSSADSGIWYDPVEEGARGSMRVSGGRTARPATSTVTTGVSNVGYAPSAVFDIREGAAAALRLTVRTPLRPQSGRGATTHLAVSRTVDVPASPVLGGV